MRRLATAVCLFIAAALCAGTPCSAQSSNLPNDLISAKAALTAAQQAKLADYVTRTGNMFSTGNPTEVVAVRNEVIELCRSPLTSEIFRRELAVGLLKAFAPLTKSPETFRATNAFLVAQFLRSSEAVDFLVANIDPETQPDSGLRASAAQQLPRAFTTSNLSPPQVDAQAKKLAAAARVETNWRAIAAEIEAIGELLRLKLPANTAEAVAESQAAIINGITERVQKEKELVFALQRGLLVARNQLTTVSGPGRGKLLVGISPALDRIKKLNSDEPEEFKSNQQQEAAFKNAVITADLLQRVEKVGGTPTPPAPPQP